MNVDVCSLRRPVMSDTRPDEPEQVREAVRAHYAAAALAGAVSRPSSADQPLTVLDPAGCSGSDSVSCCGAGESGLITSDLYQASDLAGLPEGAVLASLGCGNPTALAELRRGER